MDERVDIFDAARKPLGYTRARSEPLLPGEYKIVVGIWIVNGQGQLLITRRSLKKRYEPGKWENTGGHMDAGETPVQAVIRELREETGLDVKERGVRYLGTGIVDNFIGDNFMARIDDASGLRMQPGETDEARWVSPSELRRMMDAGEMARSTVQFMEIYKEAFFAALREMDAETGDI